MKVYILFSDKSVIGLAESEIEATKMLREFEFAVGCEDSGFLSFEVCEVGEFCEY